MASRSPRSAVAPSSRFKRNNVTDDELQGLPFIGRVWDIPRMHPYKRFKEWSDQYGPIYQINVFGVNHIWLATDNVAQDLLVKRGAIYSDRPQIKNVIDSKGSSGVGEYIPLLGHNGPSKAFPLLPL